MEYKKMLEAIMESDMKKEIKVEMIAEISKLKFESKKEPEIKLDPNSFLVKKAIQPADELYPNITYTNEDSGGAPFLDQKVFCYKNNILGISEKDANALADSFSHLRK